jgi:hypothetical protein
MIPPVQRIRPKNRVRCGVESTKNKQKNMNTKNIGGSLLPSSSPAIFNPIETPFGILVVRELPEEDTHVLLLSKDSGLTTIAKHPNGFSCHALGQRLSGKACGPWPSRGEWQKQADYIVECGGECLPKEEITALMNTP